MLTGFFLMVAIGSVSAWWPASTPAGDIPTANLPEVAAAELCTERTETRLRRLAVHHRTAKDAGQRLCVTVVAENVASMDAALDTFLARNSVFEEVASGVTTFVRTSVCAVQHDVEFGLRAVLDFLQHPEVPQLFPPPLECEKESSPAPKRPIDPFPVGSNFWVLRGLLNHTDPRSLGPFIGRELMTQYTEAVALARAHSDNLRRGQPLAYGMMSAGWGGLWFNTAIKTWEAVLRGRPVLWIRYSYDHKFENRHFRYAGGEIHSDDPNATAKVACPAKDWTCFVLPLSTPRTRPFETSADLCYQPPALNESAAREKAMEDNSYQDSWGMSYGAPKLDRDAWKKGKRDLARFRRVVETFLGRWAIQAGGGTIYRDIFPESDERRHWPCADASASKAVIAEKLGSTFAFWMLRRWASRPRTWLRRAVRSRVSDANVALPCATMHVRRGDSVRQGRRHHTPAEWLDAVINGSTFAHTAGAPRDLLDLPRKFASLFVMSDESTALPELQEAYPNLPWRALDRKRHSGVHAYSMHMPSNDPELEMVDLYAETEITARCDLFVYKRGALARTLFAEGCAKREWKNCAARSAVCDTCCGGPGTTLDAVAASPIYFNIGLQRCWPRNETLFCSRQIGAARESCGKANQCHLACKFGHPTLFSS
jgi:hypothetical protein